MIQGSSDISIFGTGRVNRCTGIENTKPRGAFVHVDRQDIKRQQEFLLSVFFGRLLTAGVIGIKYEGIHVVKDKVLPCLAG